MLLIHSVYCRSSRPYRIHTDTICFTVCTTPHITYHATFLCISCVFVVHLDPGSNITVYDNITSTELTCDMAGYIPNDSIQWYKDGALIQTNSKYSFDMRKGLRHANKGLRMNSTVSVLIISWPDTSDNGEYECKVPGHDELARTVQLTVRQGTY